MALAIFLGILAVAGIIGTVVTVRADGYRRLPTDWMRVGGREDSRRVEVDADPQRVAITRTARSQRISRRTRRAALARTRSPRTAPPARTA